MGDDVLSEHALSRWSRDCNPSSAAAGQTGSQRRTRQADKAEQSRLMRQWRTHCFPLLELQTPNNTDTQLVALSSTLPASHPLGVCLDLVFLFGHGSLGLEGQPPHRAAPATWAGRCTRHPYDSSHLISQWCKAIPIMLTCCGSSLWTLKWAFSQ